eukprot:869590-Pyramimonas_sp.AAC.1
MEGPCGEEETARPYLPPDTCKLNCLHEFISEADGEPSRLSHQLLGALQPAPEEAQLWRRLSL